MATIRLTAAQAVVRYLAAQRTRIDGADVALFAGIWAIFGHGNVAGLGEALWHARDALPTFRAHNEQAMAHAAIAYAKASNRRRVMACTTSIGPGALNMVTAAAVAHVNRLPVLLLPGDTFANRLPDPVLQQVEDFGDPTVTANDCFRPVSRFFDRITRPEQLLASLPRAIQVLTDPAECGPVTLSLSQDVQAEAWDFPESFFAERLHTPRRQAADPDELARAADRLRRAEKPLIVAGGGVLYSEAADVLQGFAARHAIPVAETQAGKGSLAWDHPQNVGGIGVTGSAAANELARDADLVLAVGTRLQDFTTGSRALLPGGARLIQLNVAAFDAGKHGAEPLVGDARRTLEDLGAALGSHAAPAAWQARVRTLAAEWNGTVDRATAAGNAERPTDAQVLGAVNRQAGPEDVVVCAAGGLPGELHKLWRASGPGRYHLEYGFSCMGYEIAGGLGVRMARPDGEVFVLVGDGSYLMLNSEIATAVMLDRKLVVVVLDNGGFGCINRLQQACGGASFNNLFAHVDHVAQPPGIDFAAHARSLGAAAEAVTGIAELESALSRARAAAGTTVIAIATDPLASTAEGGAWWDVAVPEVSERSEVRRAHDDYRRAVGRRKETA
ncbi:3D-(3,5/4)-trihydroxycyclohexane-1,2-dione acylhydrolase (decyclizing) [Thalassobaculum fulvum]|uniref:3D-(3,5/4)-trihydroxycyclohexane-1,2-dione acylhydrolase (Decyclizing) n=1 Tax=Thalassobaculum fulvum TaxID=1633335 RepID=A0A919CSE6_9PROT|nr:3D-(3,5/4)-trihydroxycyclohexane-1,2-dione acylhydrolase (decyclizing) [Thalassobaculum fulvum]GHD62099.1 3D-(3,5/4)-trihydroxycyclohexane-1,2-dione acylhydrolase (decyclizing) [Thalassobaculum fulvum]